jgi:CheY-like chemotaxis protein
VEAVACLEAGENFDVAIIDLQLPEGGGLKLVEAIRTLPSGRALPIILLSSIRLRAGDNRAGDLGVSVFVYKPIRQSSLLEALNRTLEGRQQSRKAPATTEINRSLADKLPLRILLADDNRINLRVSQAFLQKMGYRVELANNGLEVVQALERQPFDIVFLDVQMPEMDGYEAARRICQRWSREQRPRMIAMTGNALQGDRELCLEAGMDDYIAKPVRVRELENALIHWGQSRSLAAGGSCRDESGKKLMP